MSNHPIMDAIYNIHETLLKLGVEPHDIELRLPSDIYRLLCIEAVQFNYDFQHLENSGTINIGMMVCGILVKVNYDVQTT